MLGNPRNMLSAMLVCYFSAKAFRPCLRDCTKTEQCDDAKLKSSVRTCTHAPQERRLLLHPGFPLLGRAGYSSCKTRSSCHPGKSACTRSVPSKQHLKKGIGTGEGALCRSKDFTSWRVRCLPSFLFESNLPYIALYFLISSSL